MKHLFRKIGAFFIILVGMSIGAVGQSASTITQIVTLPPAVLATVTLKSSGTPVAGSSNTYTAMLGTTLTYSGTVSCGNSTAAGTVTVVGLTGTQTVPLSATGTYSCSETPTAATTAAGLQITATFNSSNTAVCK